WPDRADTGRMRRRLVMAERRLPVRPHLEQLRHQAKDLLRELRATDRAVKLPQAQHALANSYQAPSWPRLVLACRLSDAIWRDDVDAVRALIAKHPKLLHEQVLIRANSNWGPPLTYAANLGRDRIITLLHEMGATDLPSAFGRATLQTRIETARKLHKMMGASAPPVTADDLGGPAYTLSIEGTAL